MFLAWLVGSSFKDNVSINSLRWQRFSPLIVQDDNPCHGCCLQEGVNGKFSIPCGKTLRVSLCCGGDEESRLPQGDPGALLFWPGKRERRWSGGGLVTGLSCNMLEIFHLFMNRPINCSIQFS